MDPNDVASLAILSRMATPVLASVVLIILICAIGVVEIFKARAGRRLRVEDAALFAQINASLRALESRMAAVERVVSSDTYELNRQFQQAGDRYGKAG